MEKGLHMMARMMTKLHGVKKAMLHELRDQLQLTVYGKNNELVTIRLLDSSSNPRKFFDDGLVSALTFIIPPDRESIHVDFAKPEQGECTFEVTTQRGTTLLDYRAA